LAGLLVAATGSTAASLLIAAAFAGAAAAATGISFERAEDARGGIGADRSSRFRLADAPHVLRRYPHAALLIGNFVVQVFVRGLLITLIVVASIELLDMGDTGIGLLNAAIGLGGLVGALAALGLGGGKHLARVCMIALACWGLPLILIGAIPTAALAFAALFVTGVSNAVLDVTGFTLVQRGVRNEDRVAMFAIMEGLFGIGLLLGSLVAPALVSLVGVRMAFVVAGAVLPLLAVLTWRPVVRGVRGTAPPEEHLALLRRNPLFVPLPLTVLDRLAASLVPVAFGPGAVLMQKGEPGDRYLLIAEGLADVSDDRRSLRTCGPGEGVGEIALLRTVPRTATVTAQTRVRAFEIDAATFLAAIAGPAAAAAAEAMALSASSIREPRAADPVQGSSPRPRLATANRGRGVSLLSRLRGEQAIEERAVALQRHAQILRRRIVSRVPLRLEVRALLRERLGKSLHELRHEGVSVLHRLLGLVDETDLHLLPA